MSDDIAKKVRAELQYRVSDVLMVVPVVHDVIPRLSQQVLADIAKLESSSVRIEVGKLSGSTGSTDVWATRRLGD